ncbi:TRAP transporter small permease [Myxococcota bacterium]|nr:TRAP transporter small permease [Myxococcota bacterium]
MATSSSEESLLGRADARLFYVEQRLSGAMMFAMGALVTLDVVHRVFSRSPGRIASMIASLIGGEPEQHDTILAPAIIVIAVLALAYGAFRSRDPELPKSQAAVRAIAATVLATAVVQAFVRLFPEGLVWAPAVGLCLLLWVGLMGASMATYKSRHLALEMGEKLWPEKMRPRMRALSKLVTAAFTLFLAGLGLASTYGHYTSWIEDPLSSVVPSAELPKWLVFSVVPFAFGVMTVRLVGYATGVLPTPEQGEEFDLGAPSGGEPAKESA